VGGVERGAHQALAVSGEVAFLDRLVDGALILRIMDAKSYRANRSKNLPSTSPAESAKAKG